ncbi:ATP-binding protein [Herbidospora mongoliensis]|uniref:ATP-binding protein n=1 Tax=Herbidospora mongoliensis TaxID=688067 RepID=UPI0008379F4A|nr:ATP-binding protein [Herbidospora mongoliensis]
MTDRRMLLALPAEERSLGVIRHAVASTLLAWELDQLVDDSRLVIDELATNAVAEAPGTRIAVQAELRTDGLVLSCWDCSPNLPGIPGLPGDDAEDHRGLFIVETLSVKHGTTPIPRRGKWVWALMSIEARQAL